MKTPKIKEKNPANDMPLSENQKSPVDWISVSCLLSDR